MAAVGSTARAVREKVHQFLEAAWSGNLDLLKQIANDLDDGEGLSVADIKYAYKRGPLHFAAMGGKTEVCKYLLEELKLEVNTGDVDGATPLIHATRNGHTETVKCLLEHGADPAIPSELGVTALHHSAAIGNVELLMLFLSKGVDVDAQCYRGTPLIWAAGQDQLDVVRVLLEHHANPNAENDYNVTPLLAARSLACVELLIEGGANVNFIGGGATPLHFAAERGNLEIMNCLLNAGADPNIANEAGANVTFIGGGATPLHLAAERGNLEIMNCLLKAGADPNIANEEGLMPILVAAGTDKRSAVEILLPLTRPADKIPEWSADGILRYMKSEISNMQNSVSNRKVDAVYQDAKDSKEVLQSSVTMSINSERQMRVNVGLLLPEKKRLKQ